MIRNSVLYHRLWYVRKRNTKRVNTYLRVILVFSIFVLLVSYTNKMLLPGIMDVSELKVKSTVSSIVNGTVDEVFSDGLKYQDIVIVNTDEAGRVNSIQTDITRLNRLSARITTLVNKKLAAEGKTTVSISLGSLLGVPAFSGIGPDLNLDIKPAGVVEACFESEFTDAGINQTRHRILLCVNTKMWVTAPALKKKMETTTVIPVAETVIVGCVPGVYSR